MKRYENGLVLGKMYPPTKGHLYLIDTAIKQVKNLYVIVCHNKSQGISGRERVNILNRYYRHNHDVTILELYDEGMPQSDSECDTLDEFYSYWVPAVHGLVPDLDVVFTSEDYGDDFGRYLGIEHIMVDQGRKEVTISGSKIRKNPYKNWDYIPNEAKYLYNKRVALMGPESVGKTTLSKLLGQHYQTKVVTEWGRVIYEEKGNHVDLDDFLRISQIRQNDEDILIKNANKILITDTEDITTYIFSKMFYPDTYKEIEDLFLEKIRTQKKYDAYILLKPDHSGIQDGTRQFLDNREEHYQDIKAELDKNKCNYFEVGGNWNERFESSIGIISDLIS